jgi:hypothetical protein
MDGFFNYRKQQYYDGEKVLFVGRAVTVEVTIRITKDNEILLINKDGDVYVRCGNTNHVNCRIGYARARLEKLEISDQYSVF